jgi:hypothetical protein
MNKFPLGLPKGSVRAIIVFILILPVPILLIRYGFAKEEIPASVNDVLLVMAGFIFKIIEIYFSARNADPETQEEKKSENPQ